MVPTAKILVLDLHFVALFAFFKILIFQHPWGENIFYPGGGEICVVKKSLGSSGLASHQTRRSRHSWTYIGADKKEKHTSQQASTNDVVESDHLLFDKENAVGTKFRFLRVQGGYVVGQLTAKDGSVA